MLVNQLSYRYRVYLVVYAVWTYGITSSGWSYEHVCNETTQGKEGRGRECVRFSSLYESYEIAQTEYDVNVKQETFCIIKTPTNFVWLPFLSCFVAYDF